MLNTAESGFDFSSRWAKNFITGSESSPHYCNNKNGELFGLDGASTEEKTRQFKSDKKRYFRQIDTLNVVPVDLNSILYRYELNLSLFAKYLAAGRKLRASSACNCTKTGKSDKEEMDLEHRKRNEYNLENCKSDNHDINNKNGSRSRFRKYSDSIEALVKLDEIFKCLAAHRRSTMKEFLWDSEERVWRDYYIKTGTQSKVISMASVIALWAGLSNDELIPGEQLIF